MCDKVGMGLQRRMRAHPVVAEEPAGFRLSEVEVRLATSAERSLWDALMDARHHLGFRRFAAHAGLRHVAEWRGRWLALAGWQGGAYKCRPRDRWVGWGLERQFERLGLVANNTRLLVMAAPGALPNLASHFLSAMTRRLCADWLAAHGRGVVLAEAFCDPRWFDGGAYRAAGWLALGGTRGYARSNGRHTEPHGKPKVMLVRPLRRDARRLLSREAPLPAAVAPPSGPELAERDPAAMRSLYDELAALPDHRRAQGRKHTVACVLSVHLLATMANMRGCLAAEQFARALSQEQLAAIGAWRNPGSGMREPVAKSTIHRVVQSVDPDALEAVLNRFAAPRLPLARALAADGKRIRGANRNGAGRHETVALVDHATGAPVASLGFGDEGGGRAALRDLLERTDIRGRTLTLDAPHTVRDTATRVTNTGTTSCAGMPRPSSATLPAAWPMGAARRCPRPRAVQRWREAVRDLSAARPERTSPPAPRSVRRVASARQRLLQPGARPAAAPSRTTSRGPPRRRSPPALPARRAIQATAGNPRASDSVSQRSRRNAKNARWCAASSSRQRYSVSSPTTATGLPSKSAMALCWYQCRCGRHSPPGSINRWHTSVFSTSSQRVPCRLGGNRGPRNRSSSRRSHSVGASQHAPHCRGRCRLRSLTLTRTTSQSSSGASRSAANSAIDAGPASSPSTSIDRHHAARWLSLISPRCGTCRRTARPSRLRQFSTTLQ